MKGRNHAGVGPRGSDGALTTFQKILIPVLVAALLVSVVVVQVVLQKDGEDKVIRICDADWDSIDLNSAIAEFIITEGYGYEVDQVTCTSKEKDLAIQNGELDLVMECWKQNRMDWYTAQIDAGNIVNLGMTFEGSPQFWIIPQWVADEYDITNVSDMKDHWELFKDPEDPYRGVFYNAIATWKCSDVNKVKMEAYGLDVYYNIVSVGSSEALEAVFERAQDEHTQVFGYYWAPTALMGAYDWYVVEEPEYSATCWDAILAAVSNESMRPLPNACAYQSSPIDKIAHKELLEKAPNVVEMLEKMNVGLEPVNEVLAWAKENGTGDWRDAAIYYLQNYEDRWSTWVTSSARERVTAALEEAAG